MVIKKSTCVYCGCGCTLKYVVKDGKIVNILPDKSDPVSNGRPCIKGLTAYQPIFIDRIKKPMLRYSKEENFKEVTWEEAYSYIKERMSGLKPYEVYFTGSGECTNEDNYVMQKFARTVFNSNNIDSCARLCHAATAIALNQVFGFTSVPNKMDDVLNADLILAIGTNPATNYPVFFNRILEAKKKGAKLIVVHLEPSATSKFADISLNIYYRGLIAFIGGLIREVLSKQSNNLLEDIVKQFSPEYVSKVCKISVKDFKAVADAVVQSKRLVLCHGMGLTQHINGTQNAIALCDLAILKNAAIIPMRGKINVQGASDMGCCPDTQTFKSNIPGKRITEAAYDSSIKAMYIMGMNPAVSLPDLNKVHQNLKKMFVVCQHHHWNKTMQFADVILPGALLFEKDGTITNGESRVIRTYKVVEPPGKKPDWKIICELAHIFGFGKHFKYKSASQIFNEITKTVPRYKKLSWQKVSKRHDCFVDKKPKYKKLVRFDPQLPPEAIEDGAFPFLLTTERWQYHFCTGELTTRSNSLIRLSPKPFCKISQEDAKLLGIKDGDKIVIQSKCGQIETFAKINPDGIRGIVSMPFHFESALVNKLVPSEGDFDNISQTPNYKSIKVRILKKENIN